MNRHVEINGNHGAIQWHKPFGTSFHLLWDNTDSEQWGQFALILRVRGINLRLLAG